MKALRLLSIVIIATLSSMIYVLCSAMVYRIGFPLDDSWIHQTYARNFASGHGWSFEPGVTSGGITAPLWVLILSIGYWLKVNPYYFSFGIGILFLASTAILAILYFREIHPTMGWLGLFFLFEWHFVWASVSGMETVLAIFLVVAIFYIHKSNEARWALPILLAASIWVRPDLVTLSFPILVDLLVKRSSSLRMRIKELLPLFCLAVSLVIYLLFNQIISGAWFPTTFYAKQAEYAELKKLPLVFRLWQQFSISLVGGGVLLFPGFVFRTYQSVREKNWLLLSWFGWFWVMIALYAIRLPVIYHHGRYILPATVVYYLIGLEGSVALYNWMVKRRRAGWILAKAGVLAWLLVTAIFWGLGANAYAKDVQFIETQMVYIAKWTEENLPSNSRIAVHDIGAMGYFTTHDLFDLAGLINSEVIPIIRDEEKLAEYLNQQRVDYLICFPTWYPKLVANLPILHKADEDAVRAYHELPMTVFQWKNLWNE